MTATILILFGLPCAAALFVAAASHGALWYECRGTPHEARLRDLAAPRPPSVWLVRRCLAAAASQLFLFLTYPLGLPPFLRKTSGEDMPPGTPLPVLIHGLYHNPAAWLVMRRRLRRAGYPASCLLHYPSLRTGFAPVAESLADDVRGIMQRHPGRPIILMGHSLGGLFARRLVAEPDIASACRALVTLGSPHGGSRLAALGPGPLARDILPSSDVIARLRELPPPAALPCLALFSPVDAMVLPPENLRPSDASGFEIQETVVCDHVQMLFHPAVAAQVCDWLRRAAAPGKA